MDDETKQGQQLERYREYLHLLARMQLDHRLQGKVDLSGVVQQTLLEAHQAMQRFLVEGDELQAAWLRKLLAHNLSDEVRKARARCRDHSREQSLEAALEASSAQWGNWLCSQGESPSQQVIRHEELLRLARALARLPNDQRQAIELHHLKGESLAQVAHALGRSRGAVAALLFRGLRKLRDWLRDQEVSP